MRSFHVLAVVLFITAMGRSVDVLGQHSSNREALGPLVGDWVDYINGPSLKLVMHLELGPQGGLIGTITGPSPNQTEAMQNIQVDGRSFTFTNSHGLTLAASLSDDGQKLIATGGVWERLTSSAGDKHPCAKPIPNLRLDPDIQEILDGIKPKSAAEANSNLWCGSAADIDALKEVLVSGSVAEIRDTRKALVDLDKLPTLCPWNPVTFTEEQKKAHARCQQRITDQWGRAFTSLQEKMKSLVPGPDGYPPLNTADFVGDLVPILKKQAQVQETRRIPNDRR